MNPIVTLAYALVILSPRLLERAIITLFTGVILVIFIAYLSTELLGLKTVGCSFLLFVTNLAGIVFSGSLVFLFQNCSSLFWLIAQIT